MIRRFGWTALAVAALAATAAAQQTTVSKAQPELPAAEWAGQGPLSLEDFRGQTTVLIFYSDSMA